MARASGNRPIRILNGLSLYASLVIIFILIVNLFAFKYYVSHTGENLLDVFTRQNISELSEGRVIEVANRLYGSLVEDEWSCLKVSRDNHIFLDERRDPLCKTGILRSWAVINMQERGGIQVQVLFQPSSDQVFWVTMISLAELLLLLGYTSLVANVQRRSERQAFELETVKLREQAAIAKATQALAHDVRKPLYLIRAIAHLISDLSGRDAKEVLEQTLPEVEHALVSVDGMVEDVLHANGKLVLHREIVSLETLLNEAISPLRSIVGSRIERIRIDSPHSIYLNIDKRKMVRVFSNIILNALEATSDQCDIWIEAELRDRGIDVRVCNNGSFVPVEQLTRIFEEFFTMGKKSGTGLGMAIAKRIVEAHNGTLSCASSGEHRKPWALTNVTKFAISLPMS